MPDRKKMLEAIMAFAAKNMRKNKKVSIYSIASILVVLLLMLSSVYFKFDIPFSDKDFVTEVNIGTGSVTAELQPEKTEQKDVEETHDELKALKIKALELEVELKKAQLKTERLKHEVYLREAKNSKILAEKEKARQVSKNSPRSVIQKPEIKYIVQEPVQIIVYVDKVDEQENKVKEDVLYNFDKLTENEIRSILQRVGDTLNV